MKLIVLTFGTILFLTGCGPTSHKYVLINAQEYCKLKGGIRHLTEFNCVCMDESSISINYLDHL